MTQSSGALNYFDLIASLKTTREVESLLVSLDTLTSTFFKSEKVPLEEALDSVSQDFARKLLRLFLKNNLDPNDKDAVIGFFDTLKTLLAKFKVIKLVLAFDPTNKTLEKLHNFVKETVGDGYIFDIEVSPDILGGAIVIFNGKYYDLSLKKTIEEAFANGKEEILMLMQK